MGRRHCCCGSLVNCPEDIGEVHLSMLPFGGHLATVGTTGVSYHRTSPVNNCPACESIPNPSPDVVRISSFFEVVHHIDFSCFGLFNIGELDTPISYQTKIYCDGLAIKLVGYILYRDTSVNGFRFLKKQLTFGPIDVTKSDLLATPAVEFILPFASAVFFGGGVACDITANAGATMTVAYQNP